MQTLIIFVLTILLVITFIGLVMSMSETILNAARLNKKYILKHSQMWGIKTFCLGAMLQIKYYGQIWHYPMKLVGRILMRINDYQENFHKYLLRTL